MTGGVATALEEAMGQLPDGNQLVQSTLFEEEVGDLNAPSPLSGAIEPRRRKAGRPPGARSRRTEAVAAWLLSQARHPVLVMMEAYSMSPADLAARIGIKDPDDDQLIELFKLQMKMAEAAAGYVAQKLPQAVQLQAEGAVQVTFAGVSLPARGGSAGGGQVIEASAMAVRLPFKSDAPSRTDDQPTE